MNTPWSKIVYGTSAFYDGVLGIAFLFFGSQTLDFFDIEKPYNMGFLHFPAMLLLLFAVLYFRIAQDPVKYRILMPYGMGLKFSYSSVVFYHWYADSVPNVWLALAVTDIVFLILFFMVWRKPDRVAV